MSRSGSHGDVVGTEGDDWTFDDGEHHLRHADAVLRRAIKQTVIRSGADPLLEGPRIGAR